MFKLTIINNYFIFETIWYLLCTCFHLYTFAFAHFLTNPTKNRSEYVPNKKNSRNDKKIPTPIFHNKNVNTNIKYFSINPL